MLSRGVFSWLMLGVSVAWLGAGVIAPAQTPKPKQKPVSFSRQILPLLSDRCFSCHGPDASSRVANLRLDTAEGAFKSMNGKWPIVPGKPQHSMVVKRITSKDSPMPPKSSGKSLSQEEQKLITRWIEEGAKYGKLWSFEPLPATVPVPTVSSTWPKDDLDKFILDRLNQSKLTPTKPASPERWLRRVTLDLTGLPPTEEEIGAFTANPNYEAVVDRLLASPRFGERMATDWLDAARYSDSYGYQSDLLMPTWPYRDWVVNAYNKNLSYDNFLTQQIAGDLLPRASRDQILATAFNRLHRQSNEGGSIAQEFKTEYAVDRVDTFGTSFLGLTVGCARCHDHKFDPITQKEFYQLYAYFNSINEYGLILNTDIVPTPSLLLPTPEQEKRLVELRQAAMMAALNVGHHSWQSKKSFEAWKASKPDLTSVPGLVGKFDLDAFTDKYANASGTATGHKIGNPAVVDGVKGKGLEFDGENGLVLRGLPARERWEPFTWSFWIKDPRQKGPVVLLHRTGGTDVGFCGLDLLLENGYLTARVMRHWPGNAIAIKSKTQVPMNKWSHIGWSYDGFSKAEGLRLYVDGKPVETTVLANKLWKKINAYGDHGPSGGEWSFAQRFRDSGFKGGKLDEITFADRALSDIEVEHLFDGKALNNPAANLAKYYESTVDQRIAMARARLLKSQQEIAEIESGIREISVMQEANPPIPAYLLARGDYDAPKEKVTRGTPAFLPPLKTTTTNNRLDLARWATEPNHPLTARVAVNRLWQMIFGTGIVETSENFGIQGSQPSHPELLDFLARRFVTEGWDVKKTLKHFVLSATYRQDSVQTQSKVDPLNRLYARGPSNRLTAEMIRDTALAASGLLNDKPGGPPVNPYQPAGIWTENNTMSPGFVQSTGADLYKRSLYSTWKRTTPVPGMMMFDATSREACTVRRPSTNTPLQALVLLNDVQFVEAARVLAERTLEQKGGVYIPFVRLAGRKPSDSERAILDRTFDEQRAFFAADPASATKLITVGASKANPALDPLDLAAMTVVVQTILNSDLVIWKR
ncbi:MAG TPA: DUF1553 domain-containing protein [Fimbriimonas sp.]|nr:DUF1553 domain-containing protein [Fimbriimonas sp.]